MLTSYSRSPVCRQAGQFIEKTLTDAQGREYKALFFVTLEAGEIKGRLVSLKPVAAKVLALEGAVSDGTICLPCWTADCEIETPYYSATVPVQSPYFNIDLILSTQPTRAPSFA